MPCDTKLKKNQTLSARKEEVKRAVTAIDKMLVARRVQLKIGPGGGVVFTGVPEEVRDGLTDACIYRRIVATGSALARLELQRAETRSGRQVNMTVVGQGAHSHDGGVTWHDHKG